MYGERKGTPVQSYVIIALLVLNFAGVLYLAVKGTKQNQRLINQKEINDYQKLIREVSELKESTVRFQTFVQQELEQCKLEYRANESLSRFEEKSSKNDHLLLNDRYKEVFTLHEQGLSTEEIAKELGKGTGEVSFILQLAAQERE